MYLPSGSLLRSGGEGLVVVEHDAVEAVVDQVLKLGRGLRAQGVHQHARVGVRLIRGVMRVVGRVHLIVGVGVAVLHQEIMQREIDLVFADVVGQRVHDLTALLVPDIGLALHQRQRRLVADLAGAAAQIAVQVVAQDFVHVILAVLLLHHHVSGVLRQRFRHHVGALHLRRRSTGGPTTDGRARAR